MLYHSIAIAIQHRSAHGGRSLKTNSTKKFLPKFPVPEILQKLKFHSDFGSFVSMYLWCTYVFLSQVNTRRRCNTAARRIKGPPTCTVWSFSRACCCTYKPSPTTPQMCTYFLVATTVGRFGIVGDPFFGSNINYKFFVQKSIRNTRTPAPLSSPSATPLVHLDFTASPIT